MNSSEILDTALRVYQRLGLTFLRLTAVPALLCLASLGFISNYVVPNFCLTKGDGGSSTMVVDTSISVACGLFIGGPLFLLGLSYTSSIVVQLVSEYLAGKDIDADAAMAKAREVLPRLMGINIKQLCVSSSGILFAAIVMAGGGYLSEITPQDQSAGGIIAALGILILIAGVFVFLHFVAADALSAPIAVIEGSGARITSRRSRELLKRAGYHPSGTGAVWTAYFVILFVAIVVYSGVVACTELINLDDRIVTLFHSAFAGQLIQLMLQLVPMFLVVWTLTPVWASVITIIYYERKIRLEGYDIDALASEIVLTHA